MYCVNGIDLDGYDAMRWHYARRYAPRTGNRLTADDLAQEAWIGLYVAATRYRPSRGDFKRMVGHYIRGYIFMAIYRRGRKFGEVAATDCARELGKAWSVLTGVTVFDADGDIALAETKRHHFRCLTSRERYAFEQWAIVGRLPQDIAQELGFKSREGLVHLLNRAREKIIRHLTVWLPCPEEKAYTPRSGTFAA